MFSLKSKIWNFFSRFEHREDPYKNAEGKGTNQRYHEMLAGDIDENMLPMVYEMLDNTLIPSTAFIRYIPYLELMMGITVVSTDLEVRREIVKNWIPLMTIKGTLPSYQLLLGILGFVNVTIEDLTFKQGFDSPVTFDDAQRRFDDSGCQTCSKYNLHLSGDVEMTSEIYIMILRAVAVVEPINAKLNSIIYNEVKLGFSIFVSDNGDLIVDTSGTNTELILTENGDLIISNAQALKYNINNGNLIKDE